MKKLLLGILSVCLLLTMLSSCGRIGNKSAHEAYSDAYEAFHTADNYEIITTEVTTVSVSGTSSSIVAHGTYRVHSGNIYSKYEEQASGATSVTEGWYIDGVSYASAGGAKLKTEIDRAEYEEKYARGGSQKSVLPDITKSLFEYADLYDDGELTALSFSLNADTYTQMTGVTPSFDITSMVTFTAYFDDDGALKKTVTEYEMTSSGTTARYVLTAHIGTEPQAIQPPADADDYTAA